MLCANLIYSDPVTYILKLTHLNNVLRKQASSQQVKMCLQVSVSTTAHKEKR